MRKGRLDTPYEESNKLQPIIAGHLVKWGVEVEVEATLSLSLSVSFPPKIIDTFLKEGKGEVVPDQTRPDTQFLSCLWGGFKEWNSVSGLITTIASPSPSLSASPSLKYSVLKQFSLLVMWSE